jgi:Flp pilus assembly protein TadG
MHCRWSQHADQSSPRSGPIGGVSVYKYCFQGGEMILPSKAFMRFSLKRLAKCDRGVAAIEFALIGGLMCVALLNTADIAVYLFDRIQVQNAAQMGAQAGWKACDLAHIPATKNCAGFGTAVTAAVQSTGLNSKVSLVANSPSEGFYCLNSSGSLQYVSDVTSKPSDCTAAGMPSLTPADYILVQTTFTYVPLFPGLTVTGALGSTITKTAWMRLG